MSKIPRITYKESECTIEDVNKLFSKIDTSGALEELINIRKKEMLNHNHCSRIIKIYNNLFDLIGEKDTEYNRSLMDQWIYELIDLHAPIYYDLPVWPESADIKLYKWEEWNVSELYCHYWNLCLHKKWDSSDDFYKWNGSFKKYQVVDMLNYLLVTKRILQYEPRSFRYDGDNPLDDVPNDVLIPVKILKGGF